MESIKLFSDTGFLKPRQSNRLGAGLELHSRVTASPANDRRNLGDHSKTRGHFRLVWDVIFRALRFIGKRAHNAYAIFGIFLLSGAAIAVVCTWVFSELAEKVRAGSTQGIDDAVMHWIAAHQYPALQSVMLEITSLGTGVVVSMIVFIAGMFLWLNQHKHSAILLIAATLGGMLLDNLLKIGFNRPRPQVFQWGTYAFSSSFPSGHAMSSIIVYGTVAYLAARLQRNVRSRVLTMAIAALLIALICASRMYLGVHYPTDIAAGLIIGLAWSGFCMAVLEAAQLYAKRNAPEMLKDEAPAPPGAAPSS
jgi:undecaprenyl-diphosphatase